MLCMLLKQMSEVIHTLACTNLVFECEETLSTHTKCTILTKIQPPVWLNTFNYAIKCHFTEWLTCYAFGMRSLCKILLNPYIPYTRRVTNVTMRQTNGCLPVHSQGGQLHFFNHEWISNRITAELSPHHFDHHVTREDLNGTHIRVQMIHITRDHPHGTWLTGQPMTSGSTQHGGRRTIACIIETAKWETHQPPSTSILGNQLSYYVIITFHHQRPSMAINCHTM